MIEYRQSPSWPRLKVGDDGSVIGPSGKTLKCFPDKYGYLRLNVYLGGNQWKQLGAHFLVCETFHGPRPEGHVVAHRDGNPSNNAVDNLRWASPAENEEDKLLHGRSLLGERHHQAKLTEDQVHEIRSLRESGMSLKAIAEKFPVSVSTIHLIVSGKNWKHI